MGRMVGGEWRTEGYESDEEGRFERDPTHFREWIRADGSTPYAPERGRYHLYVSLACPWAHRTLLVRALKGLEEVVSVSVVDHFMGADGWRFRPETPGATEDHLFGERFLRDLYRRADPEYTGRVTVPVLWDRARGTIVNNESREIARMLDHELAGLAGRDVDLCPPDRVERVEEVIDALYPAVNNGVYRAGFAASQGAYEEAVRELFAALDRWEEVLTESRWLTGDRLTEADLFLFTTLLRFDPVYVGHFKCNLRRIVDYPALSGFLRDVYQLPEVRRTCDLTHIKEHYYRSHELLNPSGIVPLGPELDLDAPAARDHLPSAWP